MAKRLSREDIERRLLELERSPQPGELKPGAMCYSPAPPPDHWIYVCPACGKRTAYIDAPDPDRRWGSAPANEPSDGERVVSRESVWNMQGLESALSLARKLPKRSGISLDESALCVFCRPDTEEYEPVLEVALLRETRRRVRFDSGDVLLLRAFLRKSDRYRDGQDFEHSLGEEVSRLRSLLLGESPSQGEDAEE